MNDVSSHEGEDRKELSTQQLRRELEELLRRVDALAQIDSRPQEEVLGYDKDGVPS